MQLKMYALFFFFSFSSLAPKTSIIAVAIKDSTYFLLRADGVVETFPFVSIPPAKLEDIKKLQPLDYQEFIAKSCKLSFKMQNLLEK